MLTGVTSIGIINHFFRHSDKYRGFVSDHRCDSGVPPTTGIFAISSGSSMQAITRDVPPQWGQVSMSIANTRLRRCAQWTGCPGAAKRRDARERPARGCQRLVGIPPTPRTPRYDSGPVLEVGANTPWKCVRFKRCLGAKAASRAIKSNRFQPMPKKHG